MNIVTRAMWKALPPVRRHRIAIPTPEFYLHHSAGSGADETAVRGIQNFHMAPPPIGRGWSDIAYSMLIDDDAPDVDIFEGRGIGIAGGHTKGRNTVSHGLCVIGNFTVHPPHDQTLETIIALAVHGYFQGWWRAGFTGGHRDAPGASTQCPGDALWALIPTLNAEIFRRIDQGDDDMAQFTETQQQILADLADEIADQGSDGTGFARSFIHMWRKLVEAVKAAA